MKYIYRIILTCVFFASINIDAQGITSSMDTLSRNCPPESLYLGPNKAHEHGGSCINPTQFLMPILDAIYTLDKQSCAAMDMIYVGPWDARRHGGFCVSRGRAYPTMSRDCSWANLQYGTGHYSYSRKQNYYPQFDSETQSGEFVYVGPKKAHEHGGYCYSVYN